MSWLRSFLVELKRRRVYRVAVTYVAVVFVGLQAVDLVVPSTTLPSWADELFLALAILGFPVAVVVAWAFELTPEGIRRAGAVADERSVPRAEPGTGAVPARPLLAGAAVAAVALAATGWWILAGGEEASPRGSRVAVLPFSDLMVDSADHYFVEGMHDALISELARAGIPIIARTSVMRYRDTDTPVREISRELRVDFLVEGSVFRAGDSVRIQAQLIDAGSEEHRWAGTYDAELRNVLTLHRDVTRAIAQEISVSLTPGAEARLAASEPVNPEAYEVYLKARQLWLGLTAEGMRRAVDLYEEAIELDPTFGEAWAALSGAHFTLGLFDVVPTEEAYPRARETARQALTLDETLSDAHVTLGYLAMYDDRDWAEAERSFTRALELNPSDPVARHGYADLLTVRGDPEEALRQVELGLRADPVSYLTNLVLAGHLFYARRFEAVLAQVRRMRERLFPDRVDAGAGLAGSSLWELGRYGEALREFRKVWPADTAFQRSIERAQRTERPRAVMRVAADLMAERAEAGKADPGSVAMLYARAGDVEAALAWLERAVEEEPSSLVGVARSPVYDPLRSEARFGALLRRAGLGAGENAL